MKYRVQRDNQLFSRGYEVIDDYLYNKIMTVE